MNMPGFTAEASLSQERWRYHVAENPENGSADQEVLPQMKLICVAYGGQVHCGIEDEATGMSYSAF